VVADTEGAAEEGCRQLQVEYEVLPAVFDAEEAMLPGAPLVHGGKEFESRIEDVSHNVFKKIEAETGDVARGFALADAVYEGTYWMPKIQHAHMETHGTIAWRTADGRIHVRTSTQAPHITKSKLAYLFELYAHQVHVFSEFVGGGFGGKQEMLTEDLCVLAALATGRPVKWEFTRTEEFIASVSRHPMKITIKLGAKKDGTLTAMQIHTVSNTGAYGNQSGEVLASSLGSSMATYTCANKKGTGYAVYTNTVPSGAFRGYGATQPAFAIESAIDELARKLGIDPFTIRRKNMIQARDPVHSIWPYAHDGVIGSYGLDQCLDFVEQALASGRGEPKPDGDEWLEGKGAAIHARDCAPPHGTPLGSPSFASARRNIPPGCGSGGIRKRHQERTKADCRHGIERARGRHRHGLRRYRSAAVRHGDLRQHGRQRGDTRRREDRAGVAGEPSGSGQPDFRRAARSM